MANIQLYLELRFIRCDVIVHLIICSYGMRKVLLFPFVKLQETLVVIQMQECAEIKCQLDATEIFIADLIACSTCFGHHYAHHQELKSIIQWLLPVILHAVVFKLLTGVELL